MEIPRNYVDAGGLVFCGEHVQPEVVSDVLACNLYLQFAASAKHDKLDDHQQWRQVYVNGMVALGHDIRHQARQSIPMDGDGTAWKLVKHALDEWVACTIIEQAECVYRDFQSRTDEAYNLFCSHTTRRPLEAQPDAPHVHPQQPVTTPVALQLTFVDKVFQTQILLSYALLDSSSGPFLQLLNQDQLVGNIELTLIVSEFDTHRYARLKTGVLEKLGEHRSNLVIELTAPNNPAPR